MREWRLALLAVQTVGSQFAYLRQSVRQNAAAIVAEGSVKPTSTCTLVRIEDKLDVVAHLSEAVPRFWIADNVALEEFLDSELRFGLQAAVEATVISDVAATSGIQMQSYSVSVLQTIRNSLTKLETSGYAPSSMVLHPATSRELNSRCTLADAAGQLAARAD